MNSNEIESVTVEFKTSLFFCSASKDPGEIQIDVIVRTIASMMNKDGGTLYIGVDDRGFVSSSIEDEYQYMNAFPPFDKNTYPNSLDGYKRFILDWVSRNLGNFASTLLSFEFPEYDDVLICKLSIQKSKVPIWFKGAYLYVRADASTKLLRGSDITSFIMQIDEEEFAKITTNEQQLFQAKISEIKKKEKPSTKILVVYPDGNYIHGKSNVETMLEVIHRADTSKVMSLGLSGREGKGKTPYVPFIGNSVYLDNKQKGGKTQRLLDGYLVFVKYSVGDIVSKITQISNGLGLNLYVEIY